MISIIIDNHNRSYLLPLIMKAYSRDTVDDAEMIIVDDSSAPCDHFEEYLKLGLDTIKPSFRVRAFQMPLECSNMNVGRTLNIGVKQSRGDLLIINHSDMIPLNRDVLSQTKEEHQKVDGLYLTSNLVTVDHTMREHKGWHLTPGASMPRKMFDTVGGFDERFKGYGPVEPDFAWRIIYAPEEYGFTHKQSDGITFLHFKMARIPIRGGAPNPANDELVLGNRGKVRVNPDGWGICDGLEEVKI